MAAADELAELKAQIALLREQIALLEEQNALFDKENALLRAQVKELERRLAQDSRNSSKPPSSDPPKSRAERRREAREKAKEWPKRKPGGQPGHEGKTREMVGAERVDEVRLHLPERCGCGHAFEGSEEPVGEPVAHQEWELPPVRPLVIEHRRTARWRTSTGYLLTVLDIGPSSQRIEPPRFPGRFREALSQGGARSQRAQGANLEALGETEGTSWITALKAPQVKRLVKEGDLQLSLFDEQSLAEIESDVYPGERLVVCRNPLVAFERSRKREDLLCATERGLEEIKARVEAGTLRGAAEIARPARRSSATASRSTSR